MKLKITLFLLLSVFGILSCKKKDEKKPIYISQTLKDWFDYRPGTYWVFYDSLNNVVDSLYIDFNQRTAPFDHTGDSREFIDMTALLFTGTTNKLESRWNFLLSATSELDLTIENLQTDSGRLTYALIRAIPFESKTASHYKCTLLPEYAVNGTHFNSVYCLYLHDTAFAAYHDNSYYIDKEAGFISIMHNSTTFKQRLFLIRHNVLK